VEAENLLPGPRRVAAGSGEDEAQGVAAER
jgi:hypothetical protein